MESAHRQLIQRNFSALVEQTNLSELLPLLIENGVFSNKLAEEYTKTQIDVKERKVQLYCDIQRRGPQAFGKLVNALSEIGSWNLVRLLTPDQTPKDTFQSIKKNMQINRIPISRGETSTPISQSPLQGTLHNVAENIVTLHRPIVVKLATAYGTSPRSGIPCYNMKSRRRGVFFMINNINFPERDHFRAGANIDGANLNAVFSQIGFHKNIINEDLGVAEMDEELKKLAISDDLKHTDCLFVVIGSHGIESNGESYIKGSDGGLLSTKAILNIFDSKNCPILHTIPKIFIFQMCRGASDDMGSPCSKISTTESDGRNEYEKLPLYADMLIAHSTSPEHKAYRDTEKGSWFIYTLCEIMEEHAHDTHVDDMLKMTSNVMRDINHENYMQSPSFEFRGFGRYCYLNPGLPPVTPTL